MYGTLVWSLAQRFTNTQNEAEDATQEIFRAIWRDAARFGTLGGVEHDFIVTIARRRLMDRLRASPLRAGIEDLTQAEISSRLNLPLETVGSFVRLGLMQLRRSTDPVGPVRRPPAQGHAAARPPASDAVQLRKVDGAPVAGGEIAALPDQQASCI